jgi:enterobacteria phage integrase
MLHAHDMGRPKKYNYPPNMTFDRSAQRYVVRNPISKKLKKFADEAQALEVVGKLNDWLEAERQAQALDDGRPKVAGLVDAWIRDRLPFMPWDRGTRNNNLAKMQRIRRELGDRLVARTDCMFLEDWIAAFCAKADTFNDWRHMLVLLWSYGLSRRLAESNEAEKVLVRSTSKKLAVNRKDRQQLTVHGYKAIYDEAPGFLQLAMDASLVTLQARNECCQMQHAHFRDGYLFVIRDKVSGDSDMAFIKIKVTGQIDEIRSRSRTLDDTVSPYLVHRKPEHRRREWIEGKPHWTFVNPDYLTKAFAEVRDGCGFYGHLEARQRPTFHEVRGLGARLLRAQGLSEDAIRALMTHAHERTTKIYLERGAKALSDDDYIEVEAPLVLKEALR